MVQKIKSKNFYLLFYLFIFSSLHSLKAEVHLDENTQQQDFKPSEVIHWSVMDATTFDDGYVLVDLYLKTDHDFSLYSDKISFFHESDFLFEGVIPPSGKDITDPISGEKVVVYEEGVFQILFSSLLSSKTENFQFNVKYLGCTNQICLFPYVESIKVNTYLSSLPLSGEKKQTFINSKVKEKESHLDEKNIKISNKNNISSSTQKNVESNPVVEVASSSLSTDEKLARLMKQEGLSFWWILLIVLLGGFLTNLTPCVYPMIPITMRILAKQSDKINQASCLYAFGIMVVYTGLGMIASLGGGMFGQIMANTWFNLLISIVMFSLAFSMIGFGNLSFFQNLGLKLSDGKTGLFGVFFMGAGAGFLAAPCTGPILAGLITYAMTLTSFLKITALFLSYSFGFSFPYIFLGHFSSRLNQINVSPSLQTGIKICFAAVMVALGLYYLKVPFYDSYQKLHNLWPNIVIFSILLSLSTLGLFYKINRLNNKGATLFLAVFVGLSFFSTQQWVGLNYKNQKLNWYTDEQKAFKYSKEKNLPILIDMWAEWCESCKTLDKTIFSNKEIVQELIDKKWVLLRFDLTVENDVNKEIQERYNVKGLPVLIIIPEGDKKTQIKIKGTISNVAFLEKIKNYSIQTAAKVH